MLCERAAADGAITRVVNVRFPRCSFPADPTTPAAEKRLSPTPFPRSLTIFCRRACRGRGAWMAARAHLNLSVDIGNYFVDPQRLIVSARIPRVACEVEPRTRDVAGPRSPSVFTTSGPPTAVLRNPRRLGVLSRGSRLTPEEKVVKRHNSTSNIGR